MLEFPDDVVDDGLLAGVRSRSPFGRSSCSRTNASACAAPRCWYPTLRSAPELASCRFLPPSYGFTQTSIPPKACASS